MNTMSNRRYLSIWTAFSLSLLATGCIHAKQTGDSVRYDFTGTLRAMTQCKVNDDQVINVPFGNVSVNKVDSGIYFRTINYSLDCGSVGASNTVLMTLRATPVATSDSTIATSAAGLWAQFYKEGAPVPLNKEFKIDDPTSPPKLEVKLVKDPDTDFKEGAFTATATLMVEYL